MGRKGSKLVVEWVVGQEVVGLPPFCLHVADDPGIKSLACGQPGLAGLVLEQGGQTAGGPPWSDRQRYPRAVKCWWCSRACMTRPKCQTGAQACRGFSRGRQSVKRGTETEVWVSQEHSSAHLFACHFLTGRHIRAP